MNDVRIGIIGTTCTGKTTLCQEFSKKTRIPLIKEDARDLYKEMQNKAGWDRDDPSCQLDFQYKVYSDKIEKELKLFRKGFIADRIYVDNFMYFMYYCHKIIGKDHCVFMENLYKQAMSIYTHVFKLELGQIPYIQDDIRVETYSGALFYQTCMEGILDRWGVKVVPMDKDAKSVSDRIAFITQYITGKY